MTKFKAQGFNKTFKNARKGFRLVFKSEMNIRFHLVIAFVVLLFAFILKFSAIEYCIVIFAITSFISSSFFILSSTII